MIVKIDEDGALVLPKEMLEKIGLNPNDEAWIDFWSDLENTVSMEIMSIARHEELENIEGSTISKRIDID